MQGSARRGALEAGVCSSWKNHAAVRRRAAAHQRPPGGGGPRPAPFPLPRTRAMRNHRDRLPRTCGGRCSPPGTATAARGKRSPAVALPEGRRCAERRAMACCVCEQSDGGSRGAVGPRAVDSRRQRSMPDRRPAAPLPGINVARRALQTPCTIVLEQQGSLPLSTGGGRGVPAHCRPPLAPSLLLAGSQATAHAAGCTWETVEGEEAWGGIESHQFFTPCSTRC